MRCGLLTLILIRERCAAFRRGLCSDSTSIDQAWEGAVTSRPLDGDGCATSCRAAAREPAGPGASFLAPFLGHLFPDTAKMFGFLGAPNWAPSRPGPRTGAFEINYKLHANGTEIDGGLLYSKLHTRKWPNTSALADVLRDRIQRATCATREPPDAASSLPYSTSTAPAQHTHRRRRSALRAESRGGGRAGGVQDAG